MDVLILAAGVGSRLSKYTHDQIPKYLINIDENTGLFHLIDYWNKYANNIYLVINSKFRVITEYYIENILNKYNKKIIIIDYDNYDGTAYTLNYIINNQLKDSVINNLLITWCDLYPSVDIDFSILNKKTDNNIYIFTHGNKCRYLLDKDNQIQNCENNDGNIVGIYYFQNYKKFNLDDTCINNDIVIYLDKIGNIFNFAVENIVDYGDEDKFFYIMNNLEKKKFNCRYFNNIELINNDKLLKKGITDKGKEIIQFEKGWYEYIYKLNNKNIESLLPKIYDTFEYGILMEYKINYIPVYKYLIENAENKIPVLKNIFDKLKLLHSVDQKIVSKTLFFNDLKKEIYDKIIERKSVVLNLIKYFGEIKIVNNIKINSFDNILKKCKDIIVKYYETINTYQYSIILGDCQFSNILINPNDIKDIVFIDPRGYYGNSKVHGPVEYDYTKILYSISGYDNFNLNYFNIQKISEDSIEFNIEGIHFDKTIINKYFNKVHKAYLVIIWLSLAEYCKNDIWKCIASYYYGLYLGTLLFS